MKISVNVIECSDSGLFKITIRRFCKLRDINRSNCPFPVNRSALECKCRYNNNGMAPI